MQSGEKVADMKRILLAVLLGGLAALALACVLLLVCSALISAEIIPERFTTVIVILVCGISVLFCAGTAIARSGWSPMLSGICSGAVFSLLLLIVGFVLYREVSLYGNTLWAMTAALGCGAVAGACKRKTPTGKGNRKPRRRR